MPAARARRKAARKPAIHRARMSAAANRWHAETIGTRGNPPPRHRAYPTKDAALHASRAWCRSLARSGNRVLLIVSGSIVSHYGPKDGWPVQVRVRREL